MHNLTTQNQTARPRSFRSFLGTCALLSVTAVCAHASFGAVSAPAAVRAATQNSGVIQIKTRSGSGSAIDPRLTGSQFNFSYQPVRMPDRGPVLLNGWKKAHITMLRYPGGTWGDHYIWDHPEASYFAIPWANAKSIVTPEEFVSMCRRVGAEPIFQVNMVSRGVNQDNHINPTKIEDIRTGAQWAANWVREANVEKKWRVKYWELGNELWIWLHPDEYARAVVEYSKAMKAVDPSIKIIACGLSGKVGPLGAGWLKFPDDAAWVPRENIYNDPESWDGALFTTAKGYFDYIAPHPYLSAKESGYKGGDARGIYLKTTALIWDRTHLRTMDAIEKAHHAHVPIAVTEWGTNFDQSVAGSGAYKPGLYFYSQGNGINHAHYLGEMIAGGTTQIAVLHSLDEIQTMWFWPKNELAKKPLDHPAYLALKLWGNNLGKRRLNQSVTDLPSLKIDNKAYPGVFTFASEDGGNVYLVAINLDPDSAHTFRWIHKGAALAGQGRLSLVSSEKLDSDNWDSWGKDKQSIDITDTVIRNLDAGCSFDLPAHSMAGIKIAKLPAKK
jgi:hypothetical protein